MALDYVAIGARIRAARIEKKMTQEKLAEKIGVSIAFLSRVERGNSYINLRRLNEICSVLGVTEGEILNGVATQRHTYLIREFSKLFKHCPPEKLKLIYKVAKTIIED